MVPETSLDVRTDALHLLSNGVYILTTCLADTLHAATVTWVTQASIEPPLVLVALQQSSHLLGAVRKAHRFALNVLEIGQDHIAETFFTHWQGPQATSAALAGYEYREGTAHCPLLKDCLAWLDCRVAAEPASPGDHSLLLGEVTGAGVRRQGQALVLRDTRWSYGGVREP